MTHIAPSLNNSEHILKTEKQIQDMYHDLYGYEERKFNVVNYIVIGAFMTVLFLIAWANKDSYIIKPCEYEDSDMCYWNAETMGNGEGENFIAFKNEIYVIVKD